MTRHCANCGQRLHPRPQAPKQTYCSAPDCQRARKRQWQRDKLRSDPDYRVNQRTAQKAWAKRNQDYWQNYRHTRKDPVTPEAKSRLFLKVDIPQTPSAKMDAWPLQSGLYLLKKHSTFSNEATDFWLVEIKLIQQISLCRMDASREDMIDTPPAQP